MLASAFYDLNNVMSARKNVKKSTKVICTIGPACANEQTLKQMIESGMNIARLNFSHGDHKSMQATIDLLKKVRKENNSNLALLLDTKGPEIRSGFLKGGKPIQLRKGQDLKIVCDYEFLGDETTLACSYKALSRTVKIGDSILCADGSLSLTVKSVEKDFVVVKVQNDCLLGERKNMNLPNRKVELPTITEKDEKDIAAFAKEVDLIAVSFVQHKDDIKLVNKALGSESGRVKTIAKIENYEGIHNFAGIMDTFDGIMIARGDMGMEIPLEKVPLVQKSLIKQCNETGTFVVVATQMLESMTGNARPTRAEVTDVVNAVLDGADGVMLSGETAGGKFPVESVSIMAKLCFEAEAGLDYEVLRERCKFEQSSIGQLADEIVGESAKGGVSCLVIFDDVSLTAEVARFKPHCPVVLLSSNTDIPVIKFQELEAFCRGVYCYSCDGETKDVASKLVEFLKENNFAIEKVGVANKGNTKLEILE